ncbi:MAG TPA: MFS transporter [Ktedonobacterales bacterium]
MRSAERAMPLAALTPGRQVTLSLLWLGLNVQTAALLPIVLPTQILLFVSPGEVGGAQQATFLGWFSALGALIALVVPPWVGARSDHTTGSYGRRRPYIGIGALLLLLGAVVLAVTGSLATLLIGFLVFQLGNSICTAGYQGLIPDLVPEGQRGTASGYMGLMTILGNGGSLVLAGALLGAVSATSAPGVTKQGSALFYVITGAVLLLTVGVTLLRVREAPLSVVIATPEPMSWRRRLLAEWGAPWRQHDFFWVFLTRCAVMTGLTLFLTFIEYYFANVAHITNFVQETAVLALLALLGGLVSAFWLGTLSDRIGRVPVVCASTACMALAALAFVVLPAGTPLWPLGLLFGLGYGAYTSTDWALAVDTLPSLTMAGKDMGLWSIATTLPAVVAPLIGGLILGLTGASGQSALGYRLVFAVAVITLIAGAVFILMVRRERPGAGG